MFNLLKNKIQVVTYATLLCAFCATDAAVAQVASSQAFGPSASLSGTNPSPVTGYPSTPLVLRPQNYGRLRLFGGTASLAAADLTLTTTDNAINSGGQLFLDGGELVLQGGAQLAHNGTITVGANSPAGTISKIVLRAGSTIAGNGAINVLNGNVLEIIGDSGGGTLAANTINNNGTVKWGGSSLVGGGGNLTFNNYGTLILNAQGGANTAAASWHRAAPRVRLTDIAYVPVQAVASDGEAQFVNYGNITGVGTIPGDLTNYGGITPLEAAGGFPDSTDGGTTTNFASPVPHAHYASFQPRGNQSLISFPGGFDDFDNATVKPVQYYNPDPSGGMVTIQGNLEQPGGAFNETVNSTSYGCLEAGSRVWFGSGATLNISLTGFTSPQLFPAPSNLFTIVYCAALGSPAGTDREFTYFNPSPTVSPVYNHGPYPSTSPTQYQLVWPSYPS